MDGLSEGPVDGCSVGVAVDVVVGSCVLELDGAAEGAGDGIPLGGLEDGLAVG